MTETISQNLGDMQSPKCRGIPRARPLQCESLQVQIGLIDPQNRPYAECVAKINPSENAPPHSKKNRARKRRTLLVTCGGHVRDDIYQVLSLGSVLFSRYCRKNLKVFPRAELPLKVVCNMEGWENSVTRLPRKTL